MTMFVFDVRHFFGTLYRSYAVSIPAIYLSRTQKIFIICFAGGSVVLGGLAQFLKRRRRPPHPPARRSYRDYKSRLSTIRNSNFDAMSQASWARRSEASTKSHISDHASLISSVPAGPDDDVKLTPQQYGVLGLEALERALYCWEDALTAFSSTFANDALALPSKADAAFTQDVQELLDMGYQMQSHAEMLFLDQHSVLFRNESEESLDKPSNIGMRISGFRDKDVASSPESFASARDGVADLREFEEFSELFPHFEKQKLYHAALKQHEEKSIPCRRLHTELVKCGSDVEYLAKVYCLRQAYTKLFNMPTTATFIADMGRQIICDLIMYADRDPKDYLLHYERMLKFLQEPRNHGIMEEELTVRGVKCMNFYDILVDFILLDAFEEVEKPPPPIRAILQNRWISARFRETAVGTALWSILAGKRQMLKYDQGFLAHFYSISEHVSPVLVWGFLGPEGSLRSTCSYFRDQVIEFLVDTFNLFKVRYTTVDELAADVLREMKLRIDNINQRLSLEGC
ncbi:mitoguardin [Ooceraea biroi]|uniref:mitoguardin n=1 Tax=Ooceraea biroi TaxID=2015173 RepID=UPI000F077763|nr:mitoguardin [Ooceraea biroi]